MNHLFRCKIISFDIWKRIVSNYNDENNRIMPLISTAEEYKLPLDKLLMLLEKIKKKFFHYEDGCLYFFNEIIKSAYTKKYSHEELVRFMGEVIDIAAGLNPNFLCGLQQYVAETDNLDDALLKAQGILYDLIPMKDFALKKSIETIQNDTIYSDMPNIENVHKILIDTACKKVRLYGYYTDTGKDYVEGSGTCYGLTRYGNERLLGKYSQYEILRVLGSCRMFSWHWFLIISPGGILENTDPIIKIQTEQEENDLRNRFLVSRSMLWDISFKRYGMIGSFDDYRIKEINRENVIFNKDDYTEIEVQHGIPLYADPSNNGWIVELYLNNIYPNGVADWSFGKRHINNPDGMVKVSISEYPDIEAIYNLIWDKNIYTSKITNLEAFEKMKVERYPE
ncbi:hypothetical protein ACFL57_00875 [Candidatus Margulisiibacteriota bacterium]